MTRPDFLPFSPPFLGDEEIAAVAETLRSGWITTGPKVKSFEEQFAAYVEAPGALAVSSGTAAMQVALATLGVKGGDYVITSPMTFCSTVHVIEQAGAIPLLVDIDAATLNLDPVAVQATLEENAQRVAVLLPVHMGGHPCEMSSIAELALRNGCKIVEDAAHALPASYGENRIGSLDTRLTGHAVCFSFYATKNLTTGEGGMLTMAPEYLEEARSWSLHGMTHDAHRRYGQEGSWFYEVVRPGYKANMTDIQAAIGLGQLVRLDWMHSRRREIANRYTAAFHESGALQPPTEAARTSHAWHLYVLRLNLETLSIDRDRFIHELAQRKISTSVHFIPIHLHPYYRDRYAFKPTDFPIAFAEFQRMLSLPLHPGLTDSDVNDVIEAVLEVVDQYRV